jgi:hypothetical protein
VIFRTIEAWVTKNIKTIVKSDIPEIFFNFCENNVGTEEFFSLLEPKLVDHVFNMTPQ